MTSLETNLASISRSVPRHIVVLGTGGTLAGTASSADDNVGYTAGQVAVSQLLAAVPALQRRSSEGWVIESEQVAQIDSKDMGHAVWRRLAERVQHHLERPEVDGLVVTHGTDTLEETGYLLQRVLAPVKPVVLTAAMRPSSAAQPDGPQNLADAVTVAGLPGALGVVAVLAGKVWWGTEVRKVHPYRLDAFDAGDAGPLAHIEEGRLRQLRDWPTGTALGLQVLAADIWPEVQIVVSHAGADGRMVDLLMEAGVQGLVVAATGNGTVHQDLQAALLRAQSAGVAVVRALRGGAGCIVPTGHDLVPDAGALSAVQARIEILLRLLARRG
jgi:L-asparaginase